VKFVLPSFGSQKRILGDSLKFCNVALPSITFQHWYEFKDFDRRVFTVPVGASVGCAQPISRSLLKVRTVVADNMSAAQVGNQTNSPSVNFRNTRVIRDLSF